MSALTAAPAAGQLPGRMRWELTGSEAILYSRLWEVVFSSVISSEFINMAPVLVFPFY